MIIKEPCIIDTSHWDVPNWDILDPRVVGVIMKATQGKYFVDPTFTSQWLGAGRVKRPRSAYHFMELNDVSTQVENFFTACEDVGAIVSGRWMGEIEPVLDAEIELTSAVARLSMAVGITKSRLSQKKLLDLQDPERHLARNPAMVVRAMRADMAKKSVFAGLTSAVTASQLAAQYKAWLDLVEAELKVRPILYASKWTLAAAGSPAWVKDYKGWWAQYPYDPDGQSAPAYLPINAMGWWTWQYSDKGKLQGFTGDVSVFNGSQEEWAAETGGEVMIPPEPPIGETMNAHNPNELNLRKAPMGEIIRLMPANTQLEIDEIITAADGSKWAHTTNQPVNGYCASWLLVYDEAPAVETISFDVRTSTGKTGTATIELK
ncbi:MAG: hypothetical protein C4583_04295 [Anaerolineaceae bacterium]|nr:MAG: hypothetical protein C4583_04295 [Anaerolineaceae bacterium]